MSQYKAQKISFWLLNASNIPGQRSFVGQIYEQMKSQQKFTQNRYRYSFVNLEHLEKGGDVSLSSLLNQVQHICQLKKEQETLHIDNIRERIQKCFSCGSCPFLIEMGKTDFPKVVQ